MKPFEISAWPAFANEGSNPYNSIIYNAVLGEGYVINEFEFSSKYIIDCLLNKKCKVIHFHWPNYIIFGKSVKKATLRLQVFFAFIHLMKTLGRKIVWTVHNLEAHESDFPALQKSLEIFLYKNVDGFISLNKSGLAPIKAKANGGSGQKFAHIQHPYYKDYYLNNVSTGEARAILNISLDKFVFLFLGQIRTYKNVIGLVTAYKQANDANSMLLIAGKVHEEVKEELLRAVSGRNDIIFIDSYIKNEEIQLYLNAANVVVTPYNRIFNSGSIFLNISFNKPTLAPDVWAISELQQVVGSRWVKTYQGNITKEVLMQCKSEVVADIMGEEQSLPDISQFSPEKIAADTIRFYKELLAG